MADFTTSKVNGNTVAASEWNQLASINNAITSSGQTKTTADTTQTSKAIANYAAISTFYTDSGSANAYVLSSIGSFEAPHAYTNGMLIRFRAGNANTGASTVNVDGLGVKNIKQFGGTTDIGEGDIPSDRDSEARYDSSAGVFILKKDLLLNENLVINGQGVVSQRGTTFDSTTTPANSDDTYLLDRMLLLSDGNDIVDISLETSTVPTGSYSAIKFDQETANKQWAYVQIIEARNAASIIGGTASLSFKARKGPSNTTLGTLRAAIISWDSTADSVTSDVVGTWAGAGTNPTLATNWTYENTPSDLILTTSYQTFAIENVSIDTSSTTNVAIMIWCDDTDATIGDLVYLSDIKLEKGSSATSFVARSYGQELDLCQRYYEKRSSSATAGKLMGFSGSMEGNARGSVQVKFAPKRTSPTITTSAATTFRVAQGTTSAQGSSILDSSWMSSIDSVNLDVQVATTPFTNGYASRITSYDTTECFVDADSEM